MFLKGSGMGLLSGINTMIAKRRAAKDVMEQSKKDRRRALGDMNLASDALKDIKAGKLEFEPEKYKLSERATDAFDIAQSRGAEDAAAQANEQALASMVNQGDSRLRQGIQGDVFGQQARDNALAGLQGRMDATSSLAAEEQGIMDANRDAFQTQKEKEIAAAELLKTGSRADMRASKDQYGLAKKAKKRAGQDLAVDTTLAGLEPIVATMGGGGKVEAAINGARRYKTGGEFSHNTNKKAVIDEESGVKEAEFTGKEDVIVFNPSQKNSIEKMISSDDEKGLFKLMKGLFNKPQFKK